MGEERPPVAPAPPRRWPWPLRWLLGTIATLVALAGLTLVGIDSDAGHRFLVDQIAHAHPRSGLRIRIGRIDGSIFGRARLRDLRLYDTRGLFLEAPTIDLDWRPADWLRNRLTVHSLSAPLVELARLPRLRSTGQAKPILPSFDIALGRLSVARLRLGPAIAGVPRTGSLSGHAEVRSGRALVRAEVGAGAGDRARLFLDAEPAADRFDLEARLRSPANGLVAGLAGTRRPLAMVVTGAGDWRQWHGAAAFDVSGRRTLDLKLRAEAGRYRLLGFAAPSPFLAGKVQRLTAPRIAIAGEATFADRRLAGHASVRTPALLLAAHGTLDLGHGTFDPLLVDAHLLQPTALFPNMTGTNILLHARLTGAFGRPGLDYLLTAPHLAFDNTGFDDVRAQGSTRLAGSPVAVPIVLSARRVTGVGDVAGGILANLRVAGALQVTAHALTGDGLQLSSDKLRGGLQLRVDLDTGDYDVALSGALVRYLIPGLGIIDVSTKLTVVPGAGGHGSQVAGRGQAWVRRFDNAFLRSLAGGLPQIDTGLVRTPDGVLHLNGLKLTAPALTLTGNGFRRTDGSFHFEGSGRQATYGPVTLLLDGQIDHPHLELKLASPVPALGLSDVAAVLDPTPGGFAFRAAGGSRLGPFTAGGAILTPANAPAVISVADLAVAGTHAKGDLRSDPAGFTGSLAVAGGGITGTLGFAPQGTIQAVDIHLAAADATLPGATPVSLRRGRLDARVLLDPAGTGIDARFAAVGVRRGGAVLAHASGTAQLKAGKGPVALSLSGSRGRAFDLRINANLDAQGAHVTATGTVDRQPVTVPHPALVAALPGGGYRIDGAELDYAGGRAALAGRFGTAADGGSVTLQQLPLSILDLLYPTLGLGGTATGSLAYDGASGTPVGRADLTVRGLTRAGLVLSSQPVDLGLAARLDGRGLVGRAVVASGGQTIGRAQARVAPLAGGGDLATRLERAPLFAQLRYAGPADTLWRLTGVEGIDLSGPLAIGADVGGTIGDPSIRGSVTTSAGRLDSAVTGTVIQGLALTGRFNGSQLVVDHFTGGTPGGGTLAGRARFDLAAAHGLGFAIDLSADNALLLNAEDIGASVTGPLSIRSDGAGGTISGNVKLMKSRFRLGQAAAAAVPRLAVREVNRGEDEVDETPPPAWKLDLKARASNRIAVSGLGLDSEWRADLGIGGTVDAPRITGEADLIRGGYQFAGRRFDLSRGIIRFNGESPPDPYLDITAEADITGLSATIRVSGTGQKPELSFQSTPALPEDELLSRLLFGTSITNLSAPEALQLASAVASLRSGSTGLDPINAVRRAAGLDRLRILPADTTTGARTSVAAGKYVTRRIYVEVSTDGQGYSATRVEWELTRWLSLLSSISTLGRTSADVRISKDY